MYTPINQPTNTTTTSIVSMTTVEGSNANSNTTMYVDLINKFKEMGCPNDILDRIKSHLIEIEKKSGSNNINSPYHEQWTGAVCGYVTENLKSFSHPDTSWVDVERVFEGISFDLENEPLIKDSFEKLGEHLIKNNITNLDWYRTRYTEIRNLLGQPMSDKTYHTINHAFEMANDCLAIMEYSDKKVDSSNNDKDRAIMKATLALIGTMAFYHDVIQDQNPYHNEKFSAEKWGDMVVDLLTNYGAPINSDEFIKGIKAQGQRCIIHGTYLAYKKALVIHIDAIKHRMGIKQFPGILGLTAHILERMDLFRGSVSWVQEWVAEHLKKHGCKDWFEFQFVNQELNDDKDRKIGTWGQWAQQSLRMYGELRKNNTDYQLDLKKEFTELLAAIRDNENVYGSVSAIEEFLKEKDMPNISEHCAALIDHLKKDIDFLNGKDPAFGIDSRVIVDNDAQKYHLGDEKILDRDAIKNIHGVHHELFKKINNKYEDNKAQGKSQIRIFAKLLFLAVSQQGLVNKKYNLNKSDTTKIESPTGQHSNPENMQGNTQQNT